MHDSPVRIILNKMFSLSFIRMQLLFRPQKCLFFSAYVTNVAFELFWEVSYEFENCIYNISVQVRLFEMKLMRWAISCLSVFLKDFSVKTKHCS